MKTIFFVLVSCFILPFNNCGQVKNPLGFDFFEYTYPMKIGNQWEYDRGFYLFNIRPDSIKSLLPITDTLRSYSSITIPKQEILKDSLLTYQLIEDFTEDSRTITSESYYLHRMDGLYLCAYKGVGLTLPKSGKAYKIIFKGLSFNKIHEITDYLINLRNNAYYNADSLYYENPPLQTLKYPLKTGLQWTIRESGEPWLVEKKVISEERIKVPAGRYDCIKIQYLIDLDGDNKWDEDIILFDYIGKDGLIKRSGLFKDLIAIDEFGMTIGIYDVKDESNLTKAIIK